jgi:hypothetical protein
MRHIALAVALLAIIVSCGHPKSQEITKGIIVTVAKVERVSSLKEGDSEINTEAGRDFARVTLAIEIKETKLPDGGIVWEGSPTATYYGDEGRDQLVTNVLAFAQGWQFELADTAGEKVGGPVAGWVFADKDSRRLWFYTNLPVDTRIGVIFIEGKPLSAKN